MPPQVLKPSSLEIHRRHEHKNTPPFRTLFTIDTDSLSSLISFSNFDDTAVDYIIVKYEAKILILVQATIDQGLILIQKMHNTL